MSCALMGLQVQPSLRGRGLGTIFVAIWLRLCTHLHMTPTTKTIDKPLISLLLQKFNFVPAKRTCEIEVVVREYSTGSTNPNPTEVTLPHHPRTNFDCAPNSVRECTWTRTWIGGRAWAWAWARAWVWTCATARAWAWAWAKAKNILRLASPPIFGVTVPTTSSSTLVVTTSQSPTSDLNPPSNLQSYDPTQILIWSSDAARLSSAFSHRYLRSQNMTICSRKPQRSIPVWVNTPYLTPIDTATLQVQVSKVVCDRLNLHRPAPGGPLKAPLALFEVLATLDNRLPELMFRPLEWLTPPHDP